ELGDCSQAEFRMTVDGGAQKLQPATRFEIYSIGREALVNAFRHSHASKIELQLQYSPSQLRVLVRDNGCGIEPHILHAGRKGHWGLSGMRQRAEKIGAKLKLSSKIKSGTEMELRVPGRIAFMSDSERHHSWIPAKFLAIAEKIRGTG